MPEEIGEYLGRADDRYKVLFQRGRAFVAKRLDAELRKPTPDFETVCRAAEALRAIDAGDYSSQFTIKPQTT